MITGTPEIESRLPIEGHESKHDRIARRWVPRDARSGDPWRPVTSDVNMEFRCIVEVSGSVDLMPIRCSDDLFLDQACPPCKVIGLLIVGGTAAADKGHQQCVQTKMPRPSL